MSFLLEVCGKCLFDTLKSQAIRDGKRPNPVGLYPATRPPNKKKTKRETELERLRPPLKGRLLTGSCPVRVKRGVYAVAMGSPDYMIVYFRRIA